MNILSRTRMILSSFKGTSFKTTVQDHSLCRRETSLSNLKSNLDYFLL
jgi:hypothetical protein